jgi:Resolvase, N terminal domain/Recombinase
MAEQLKWYDDKTDNSAWIDALAELRQRATREGHCYQHVQAITVAIDQSKVDRLTRSVAFLSRLLEANVDVRFADLPQIEGPTGRFMLQQMASVAELEAGMISKRTKDALAAAKCRGTKLGGYRGVSPNKKDRKLATESLQARAASRAADVAPIIAELQAAGKTSLRAIADGLNEKGIPTARGNGEWSAVQVKRVLGTEILTSPSYQPRSGWRATPCGREDLRRSRPAAA